MRRLGAGNEFHAVVKHHVSKADKNSDGVVDDEEMGAAEANALNQLKEFESPFQLNDAKSGRVR